MSVTTSELFLGIRVGWQEPQSRGSREGLVMAVSYAMGFNLLVMLDDDDERGRGRLVSKRAAECTVCFGPDEEETP